MISRRALVLLALIPALAGCWCGLGVRREVPVPPASAKPEEVVLAYIEAMVGKDKETARAVMVPDTDFETEFSHPNYPFQSWIWANDITIGEASDTTDCPKGERCQSMGVTMHLCEVDNPSLPDGNFAHTFWVQYVKDRWLVSGFGSG
ncbi:hypothetical protein [Acrocarpospora catenulata]|uniref:hypothetical protein n=1 Tax=Acrocarpospora catenulata TaxID=2836182 RepID=UPI001BDB441E|nr:hypothetical protein [Acrocarpospora catenulata]